jgi:hypothetical protein
MNPVTRLRCLHYAVGFVGLLFTATIYPLVMAWWPSPARWPVDDGEQMLLVIYVTLGIFLLIASRNPLRNRSLIWFAVWSSVAHGGIMALQAIHESAERAHYLAGVAAMFVVAILLGVLMPRGGVVPEPDTN